MNGPAPKVVIAGATGFIGRNLTTKLIEQGSEIVVLTRDARITRSTEHPRLRMVEWNGRDQGAWSSQVDNADAVINLCGQSIGTKRWTAARKQELLLSRTEPTEALVQAIRASSLKPRILINASAVGYYGNVDDEEVTEEYPSGKDFLGRLCSAWESAALGAESSGIRVVLLRTGVVLDKNAGALQRMLPPFKMFAGGPLGTGAQWFPWIHREDVIRAILFTLQTKSLSGPVNIVAPEQTTMRAFSKVLGRVLHRPSALAIPPFVLKALLGEMSAIVLTGQKAVPSKLKKAGFEFRFPTLAGALEDILK